MAIKDWPAYGSDKAFWPASAELLQWHNNKVLESILSGDVQTQSVPGARWGWILNFPKQTWAERGRLLAFLSALNGKEHRIRLFDPRRPPGGTLVGRSGVTLGASASQFATSLTLANAWGKNRVKRSKTLDNAYWLKSETTISANATTAPDGSATADLVVPSTNAQNHFIRPTELLSITNGQTWTVSEYMKPGGYSKGQLTAETTSWTPAGSQPSARFDLALGTVISQSASVQAASIAADVNGWWRCSIRMTASADFQSRMGAWVTNPDGTSSVFAGDGSGGVNMWGQQMEQGALSSYEPGGTLLRGDWLNLPTIGAAGQLVMAVADGAADDTGAMTVEIRHPLRAAVANGGAVTLLDPTALYILQEGEFGSVFDSALAPPMSVEIREVFA